MPIKKKYAEDESVKEKGIKQRLAEAVAYHPLTVGAATGTAVGTGINAALGARGKPKGEKWEGAKERMIYGTHGRQALKKLTGANSYSELFSKKNKVQED